MIQFGYSWNGSLELRGSDLGMRSYRLRVRCVVALKLGWDLSGLMGVEAIVFLLAIASHAVTRSTGATVIVYYLVIVSNVLLFIPII